MLELSAAARSGGGDLLDAGCGAGWWLRRLCEAGVEPDRLHGVDLLDERVAKARRAVPRAHLAAGDVRRLPYADEKFRAVFLVTVLSSLPDAQSVRSAVAEAWRVLAPGGVMVVWEARWPNPLNQATRLVRAQAVSAVTGAPPAATAPITLAPPLARRLGPAAQRWHPRLARVPPLRTHRLSAWLRPPGRDRPA